MQKYIYLLKSKEHKLWTTMGGEVLILLMKINLRRGFDSIATF